MVNSLIAFFAGAPMAVVPSAAANCPDLPSAQQLHDLLNRAPENGGDEGGLFHGMREWAVVVNRQDEVCAVSETTADPTQVWPGSLSIAKANAFSVDDKPLFTARLYTLTQPGHSLWGIAASNPFVALDLKAPSDSSGNGSGKVEGGLIAFGGGLGLHRSNKIVGAFGVSGDTACTGHETAKLMRNLMGLNPPGGQKADDITYPSVDGPSVFSHPLRPNTYRDGKFLSDEEFASYETTTEKHRK